MSYAVDIRRNATGEIRRYVDDDDWDYSSEFLWTVGNFGCDCNRYLFFQRAADEDEDDDVPCGTDGYTVMKVTLHDGTIIDIDGCEAPA